MKKELHPGMIKTGPVSVEEADVILSGQVQHFGNEDLPLEHCLNRVLAKDLLADRDLPPFDRVCMDGIAISYSEFQLGRRSFTIERVVAAGDTPVPLSLQGNCVEIMTGAPLPTGTDTVIRYEDLLIENGMATIIPDGISQGQHVHHRGKDKRKGTALALAYQSVDPAVVAAAASVGATTLTVKKLPEVVIISTGNELVDPHLPPQPWQIRRSNDLLLHAMLKAYGINAQLLHANDDVKVLGNMVSQSINAADIVLLTGGVSAGKFDHLPEVFEQQGVKKLFYKVLQRPGKPFWMGKKDKTMVFAFPGNPVSAFLCMHRYFIPWLKDCLGIRKKQLYAVLEEMVEFKPALRYFLQTTLSFDKEGKILARPIAGNGSGDFSNLVEAEAFLELPAGPTKFEAGSVYPVWPFKQF